jgi:hypothetical protein
VAATRVAPEGVAIAIMPAISRRALAGIGTVLAAACVVLSYLS